ncbi:MAG: hypothetical protein M1828_003069 [Chrysothrix sp. TS-e1954]|nr:MAG: hypothetical protein M1828_003069 [Chrysothrix sp. TS-e1954]
MPAVLRRSVAQDTSSDTSRPRRRAALDFRDGPLSDDDIDDLHTDLDNDTTSTPYALPYDSDALDLRSTADDLLDLPTPHRSTYLTDSDTTTLLADQLTPRSYSPLTKRQTQTVAIPLTYKGLDSGPSPGATVGIVLGSVAGALLLLWVINFTIIATRNATGVIEADADSEVVIERHHRSHSSPHRRRKRRSRHHSSHHSEVSQRTAPPPAMPMPMPEPAPQPPPERRERILVSETRRTERSRARQPSVPPPAATMSESRGERESVFEETRERRVEGDDVVEVFEEHSELSSDPPKRRGDRDGKRNSGFRVVDPNAYAGGDFPRQSVYDDGGGGGGGGRRRSSGRR